MKIGSHSERMTLKVFSGRNALKGAQGRKATSFVRTEGELYFLTIPERWRFQAIKYRVPGGILWYTEINSAWKIEINSNAFDLRVLFCNSSSLADLLIVLLGKHSRGNRPREDGFCAGRTWGTAEKQSRALCRHNAVTSLHQDAAIDFRLFLQLLTAHPNKYSFSHVLSIINKGSFELASRKNVSMKFIIWVSSHS